MARKRIVVDETDDGCMITVYDDREAIRKVASKIQVFEVATDARDFLVAEAAAFNWGGTP